MRTPRKLFILSGFLLAGGLTAACLEMTVGDESMYLTGTEEYAVVRAGVTTCTNPKKVLICHIPPGNPANAHSICVGESAVEPHQRLHGDGIGACGGTPPPPPGDDAGTPPPPPPDDAPPPPPDDGGVIP